MKISIIIATFNSGKTLRQTLDSIRNQTYENLEVIIVDGKSTDNTLDIVKEYSDTVTKWISEEDTGIYNAFNKGIKLATGDYVCFIGSDDCYCNYDVFKEASTNLTSFKEMYSFPVIGIDEDTGLERLYNNIPTKEDIFSGSMIPHNGILVRRDIMIEYLYDEDIKITSDYQFLLRYLINGGQVVFCDNPLVYYSEGGTSSGKIGSNNWATMLSEHIVMLHKLGLEQYTVEHIKRFFPLDKINSISYHFRCIRRVIRHKLGISDSYKKYFKFWKRHKCKLKICRWCNRF